MTTTKRRNKLNPKQIHLLILFYKFRYLNSTLLAKYKKINQSSTRRSLKVLYDQKYINRRYSNGYKLLGKAPTYSLAPKAIFLLKTEHQMNPVILQNMYKSKSLTDGFIDHNLDILDAYISIRDKYPDTFNMFTKSELGDYDYFPDDKPDLYLHRLVENIDKPTDYILNIYTDTQVYFIKKKVASYIDHFDSNTWQDKTGIKYPTILIACPDSRSEDNLRAHVVKILDNMGVDDLNIYITTTRALVDQYGSGEIWTNIYKPDELFDL